MGNARADAFIKAYNGGANSIRMQGLCNMKAMEVYRHIDELRGKGSTFIDGNTVEICPNCGKAKYKGYYCNRCEPVCIWCGKTFIDNSANHTAILCSDACRHAWWMATDYEKEKRRRKYRKFLKVIGNEPQD